MERTQRISAGRPARFSRHFSSLSFHFPTSDLHVLMEQVFSLAIQAFGTWRQRVICYSDLKQSGLMPVDYKFF